MIQLKQNVFPKWVIKCNQMTKKQIRFLNVIQTINEWHKEFKKMGLEDWETKRKQPVPYHMLTGTVNQYTSYIRLINI